MGIYTINKMSINVGCSTCKNNNKDIKLFLSNCCYYKVCSSCLNEIFKSSINVHCFQCGEKLERNRYRAQSLEEIYFIKEANIRRWVNSIYKEFSNKFKTKQEVNNYLE